MDIPYELWNETSAEVADLKKQVLSHFFNTSSSGFAIFFISNKCFLLNMLIPALMYVFVRLCMSVYQCDVLVERYEDVIEEWYRGSQEEDLTTYLCEKHVLKGQDKGKTPTSLFFLDLIHFLCHRLSFFFQLLLLSCLFFPSVQPVWMRSGAQRKRETTLPLQRTRRRKRRRREGRRGKVKARKEEREETARTERRRPRRRRRRR